MKLAMSYASQALELCPQKCSQPTKARLHTSPGLSPVGILLLMVCSTYGFCVRNAEEPRPVGHTGQAKSESTTGKRPVTVADSIQMTRLGDVKYNDGWPSKGLVAKFSPDGKRFIVILRKGNLEANTNEYSLILFETDEVFQSPQPRVLLSMSSSSNRPAIQNVVWRDDNDTILFLGERPGETTQLYSLKCSSQELTKLTNHATNLSWFVAAAKGDEIVFAAEDPEVSFVNEKSARQGIAVTSEAVADLIAGKHGGAQDADYTLFLKQAGSEAETRITTEGRVLDNEMWLSPDGLHLLVQTEAARVPEAWTEYDDQMLKAASHLPSAPGAYTGIWQYEVIDLPKGTGRLLVDAPIAPHLYLSEAAWSPDSQSVVVSDMYLPMNMDDAAERALRKTHTFLAEVKIASRQIAKISDEDLLLLEWDAKSNDVACDVGRTDSLNGKTTPKAYFKKSGDNDNATWSRSSSPPAPAQASAALPDIVLDENMNRPPRIFAIGPDGGKKSLLMDLNPQFQSLAFARVEELTWKIPQHKEVKAGLYWPLDYVAGKKYPLVVQTHAWDPDRFWIDGPWTTAFAAQALAGNGFFVLQLPEPSPQDGTPKEVPAAMAMYDSAIDLLDRKGLIDRDRIGITGFSRTFLYVTYTLTHSKHHFAAAAVADGIDSSYFQYMAFSNSDETLANFFDQLNGARPFGKGLLTWFKVSPAFLMDKVEAPLRIQALGPASLLSDWHWFSGLTRLGKPVEMIYILDGLHALEKPWDRMISQQGNVDWFCFWIKGEEDPDPAKAEQYQRWHHLRGLNAKGRATVEAH
jgi:hypothetical protein